MMVPIIGEATHEDPSICLPEDRVKYFGQENHVRLYGMDFRDRLCGVGFEVKVIPYEDVFGGTVERNFQHDAEGTLFIAYKPVVSRDTHISCCFADDEAGRAFIKLTARI